MMPDDELDADIRADVMKAIRHENGTDIDPWVVKRELEEAIAHRALSERIASMGGPNAFWAQFDDFDTRLAETAAALNLNISGLSR